MAIRVESEWYFNPECGQICGLNHLDEVVIRYQIRRGTQFSREAWNSWWSGGRLAITYPNTILGPNVGNPPVVNATEIKAVSAEITGSGEIPEMPQYLNQLK